MCSLTLALAGITTGLQMAGQYQQSRAQAAAYEAQAEAAQRQADAAYQNAKIQGRKGEQIAEQYAQEQRRLDNQRRLVVGQQTAQAGASGLAGGVGSSLDVYNASMAAWNEDSLNLLNNKRNSIYDNYVGEVNLRNQGNEYTAQSSNYKAQARAAKDAGNMAMFTTLLSGAASMYGMKGAGGGSETASTATAQTPTAAGYQANALDTAMSGISGYTPVTRGSVQGFTQSFGPKVRANSWSGWNGRF